MISILLLILITLFSIYFYLRVIKPHSYWKNKSIRYVEPWPIVGNMGSFAFRTKVFSDLFQELYDSYDERYVGIYQFLQPTLMIKDLDLIKQIGVKDFESFLDHRPFITEEIDPFMGKNLFALTGQRWRNMRSILSPAFTGSKMRSMYVLMSDCAERFTDFFTQECQKSSKPLDVEMRDVLTRYANDVIATCAFGIECNSLKEPKNEFYIKGLITATITPIMNLKFFGYTLSPALMKLFRIKIFNELSNNFFRNLIKTTMETREKFNIYRPDIIHLLMEAKKGQLKHDDKKDESAGFATVEESSVGKQSVNFEELTDDDLIAQAVIFFIAGFDSVSTNMCHLANELAINPDIQKRLQEEIDQAFEDGNGKLSYETITQLKYLDMCVSEGLRKWPAASITDRVCNNKSYTIKGIEKGEKDLELVKGDLVMFPIYALHHDPKYFPEPHRFEPERFSDDNKKIIQQMSYIPFGVGPRNCIGSRFALLEIKTIMAHILRKFDIVVTEKTQIPLKLKKGFFNLHAEKGFWLGFKPRNVQ